MFAKLLKLNLDLTFICYAYAIGYLYMAVPYLLGYIILPCRKVLRNYELSGDKRSLVIISAVSGTIFFALFTLALKNDPNWKFSILELLFWYFGYFIWGYFALFLLADYRKKKKLFS